MPISISVIVVNYNGLRFLKRCLSTLKNQSLKDFEILVIDNSSRDNSVNFIKQNFPSVKMFIVPNKGYGTACNVGADHARGRYLAFLNEDMYVPKDFLYSLFKYHQEMSKKTNDKVAAIGCKIIPFDSDPKKTPNYNGGKLDVFGFPSDNKNPKLSPMQINGCPFFITRNLFYKSRGFNKNIFLYSEDADLCWRLKLMGYDCYVNNNTYLYHYGGGVTGAMTAQKVANIIYGAIITVITNFSGSVLLLILPFYAIYFILLNVAFLLLSKLDISYNRELLNLILRLSKDFKSIIKTRKITQKLRKKSDWDIKENFTLIPAVLLNVSFKRFFKKTGRV